jgi:two-component system chemotaxis sensor kinase CheA
MDDLLREFRTETNENIDLVDVELVRFEQDPNNAKILDRIFRLVHTIKGTCGFLNLPRLEQLTHAAEALMGKFRDGMPVSGEAVTLILATIDRIKVLLDELERAQREQAGDDQDLIVRLEGMGEGGSAAVSSTAPYQELQHELRPGELPLDDVDQGFGKTPGPNTAARAAAALGDDGVFSSAKPQDERSDGRLAGQSIRVNVDTLEQLMTMVSELVLTRNQLLDIVRRHQDSEFKVPLQRLSTVTAELQDGVMKTRMQPIGSAWQKLPRVVRDLSTELGKHIELEMHGAETELDRQVLDLIKDPLTHMVRNSADHGLETPAERRTVGKPEKATIRLAAWHEGGHILIEVADDGRGLDTARIKATALARRLAIDSELDKMSEPQLHQFIFTPGFSTAGRVTSVSGRGVGLDVVRSNIDQIGGTIDVKSVSGEGTSFLIKIPLTLAIVSALIVEAGGNRFAIPQLAVVELVRVRKDSEHRIDRVKDAAVMRLRNKLLPLVRLASLLELGGGDGDLAGGFVVVTEVGSQLFGIVVDGVFHTEEIVVKPMSNKLRHIPMFCGTTILGDGAVIMIIDPNGVASTVGGAVAARQAGETEREAQRAAEESNRESLLVFRAGSPQPKAVLLSLVTRLEEIEARSIESAGGRPVVQYRGQLMPLVAASEDVRIRSEGTQPLLVFADQGRAMGLIVDEIIDIVEERFDIELASGRPGVLGSAVIKGQATDVIDLGHFLPLAFDDWLHWTGQQPNAARRRVLLIDDAPFFRNMLAPVLKAAGYAATTVAAAEEALTLLRDGAQFDVILTDIEMPGMSGFDLAAAVRGNPRTASLPIIGLSSLVSAEAIERGREVGLHDYVAKFDRHGLIAALKEQTADLDFAA